MPGSEPAIANAGADTVVVWKDGRTQALRGNLERARPPTIDLWWNRVTPAGPGPLDSVLAAPRSLAGGVRDGGGRRSTPGTGRS